MSDFDADANLKSAREFLDGIGLGILLDDIKVFFPNGKKVTSGWEKRKKRLDLARKDVTKVSPPLWSFDFMLFHELGHRYLDTFLRKDVIKEKVTPLFGSINGKYRICLDKRRSSPHHVTPYSVLHPEDDFCDVFALCMWSWKNGKDPMEFVRARNKSDRLVEKIRVVSDLIGMNEY